MIWMCASLGIVYWFCYIVISLTRYLNGYLKSCSDEQLFDTSLCFVMISVNTAPGISASPAEDNMRYFNVMILGPSQSPYEGK